MPRDQAAEASRTIDALMERDPPAAGVRGNHFYFPEAVDVPPLIAFLTNGPARRLAESLTGPGTLEVPRQVQAALNIPPFPHRPGRHHIDGYPPWPDGRPGTTLTMLAGVLMSDQLDDDAGNLWVWPGTHVAHAEHFREHGPEAFFESAGYPPIRDSRRAGNPPPQDREFPASLGCAPTTAGSCRVIMERRRRHNWADHVNQDRIRAAAVVLSPPCRSASRQQR